MKLNNIDLNKLAIFAKIVEAGNYRLASELLNVTPSALSQTISSLEHSLGTQLFHRMGKKLLVTDQGARIQAVFQKHLEQLIRELADIDHQQSEVSGLLRIGSYFEFGKYRLVPLLAPFQKKYPNIQIKFIFDTPSRLHRLLETNKIDLCFSIYPERNSKQIESIPYYQEELVLIAPLGLLPNKPEFNEIMKTPMIEYYFNHQPIRRWLALHYRRKPKHLPIRSYGASAEIVFGLVRNGLGIGVIPEYLLSGTDSHSLSICRPTSQKLKDHVWMLRLKQQKQPRIVEAFIQSIFPNPHND